MNDDELVNRLLARMDGLPDVVVPQPRVWDAVRRRRRARLAAAVTATAVAIVLGAVTAVGAPWAPDPPDHRSAVAPGPTRTNAPTPSPTPSPTPTATSAMDCVAPSEAEVAGRRSGHAHIVYARGPLEVATEALAGALARAGIVAGVGPGGDYSYLAVGGPVISTDCATQARVLSIAQATIGDIPVEFVVLTEVSRLPELEP